MGKCRKAPAGWSCSRRAGHSGPCAASPAPCDLCQDTGFMPTNIKFEGVLTGEEPKMEVTFMRCTNGCAQQPEIIMEWFGDLVS